MKRIILCLILSIAFFSNFAQCTRFAKYPIGDSETFAYFVGKPDSVEVSKMENGNIVYSTSNVCNNTTFGILVIKFANPISADKKTQQELLINYMNVTKELCNITKSTGVGLGHTHPKNAEAQGIIDFCSDAKDNNFNLKAWINTRYAAILYISFSPQNELNFNIQQLFLNGFRFSGKE